MRWPLVFFVLLALGSAVIASPVCTHVDMKWIAQQAPLPKEAKIVYKRDQGVLCEVVLSLDGDLVPLYAGKDFILVGNLFKNKRVITRETLDALADVARNERAEADGKKLLEMEKRRAFFQQNLRDLDALTLFSFKPGRADKFLYVATDPDCSHCKKLLQDLEILAMENHFEIKIILFPILGNRSRDMAAQAICEKVSYETYGQIQFDPDASGCHKAEVFLEKAMTFFSQADLSFVPVVISDDASWVVEGNDIAQVKHHLGILDDEGAANSTKGSEPIPGK